uniref:CCAAT-binding factor domain-containing protein n=1 Tax=Babesia bovis TaxID=5865 RepID=A7ASS6_BABBO|eukprot:XP_001609555.1 hypothetical protein [Babesia bovis T2Bo]
MKSLQPVGRGVADGTLLSIINAYESTDWHGVAQHNVGNFSSKDDVKVMSSAKLLREGKELLNVLSRAYSRYTCANDSQKAWMRTAAKDVFLPLEKKSVATLTDSLDSMAVLASECCPLNYKFITSLFNMCQNSALRVMMSAVERMHAVFMEVLPNRKLRYIDQLDTSCVTFLSYHLSLWEKNGASTWDSLDPNARLVLHAVSFEDFFKGAYAAYIQLVKDQLEGGVFFVQRRMLQYVFEMLAKKPEQEGLLLDILVTTLFNGDSKLSSIASTKLTALLECHSGMKGVVVNRFGTLLLGLLSKVKCGFTVDKSKSTSKRKRRGIRSSVSPEWIPTLQSVHRGLQFLSSIAFTRKDTKATAGAIKCYISVLSFIFATKPDANNSRKSTPVYELEEFSRIIRCISSGLERCVTLLRNSDSQFDLSDYISGDSSSGANLECTINSLYNAAGNPVSLKTNIALLSLLSKIHSSEPRFYNLLYDRILDLRIYEAENRRYFLSLVTRFITHVDDISIIAAFVKRLLQVWFRKCIIRTLGWSLFGQYISWNCHRSYMPPCHVFQT